MQIARRAVEVSVAQLTTALQEARLATVARANALARACGVERPHTLLDKRLDEHKASDQVAAGTALQSSSAGQCTEPTAAAAKGLKQKVITRPGRYYGSPYEWHALIVGTVGNIRQGVSKHIHHPQIKRQDDVEKVRSTSPGFRFATEALGLSIDTGGQVVNVAVSGNGFTREWCREVETWCRETCCRFRQRMAGEVARSGRRLCWLVGRGATRHGGARSSAGGSDIRGEELASLAAYGDVSDLIEIVGSIAEFVVIIEEANAGEIEDFAGTDMEGGQETDLGMLGDSPPAACGWQGGEHRRACSASTVGSVQLENTDYVARTIDVTASCTTDVTTSSMAAHIGPTLKALVGSPELHQQCPISPGTLPVHREESENEVEPSEERQDSEQPLWLEGAFESWPSTGAGSINKYDEVTVSGQARRIEDSNSHNTKAVQQPTAQAPLRGSLTLNPSAVGAILGVTPLSAFVLGAGRSDALCASSCTCNSGRDGAEACECSPAALSSDDRSQESADTRQKRSAVTRVDTYRRSRSTDQAPPGNTSSAAAFSPSTFAFISVDGFLSTTEKSGFALALQSLVLPCLRLSTSKCVAGSKCSLRLRLVPSKAKAAERFAAGEPGNRKECRLAARTFAKHSARIRRFLQAPVVRWVARVDGRRGLMSCPAAHIAAPGPSVDAGPRASSEGAENAHSVYYTQILASAKHTVREGSQKNSKDVHKISWTGFGSSGSQKSSLTPRATINSQREDTLNSKVGNHDIMRSAQGIRPREQYLATLPPREDHDEHEIGEIAVKTEEHDITDVRGGDAGITVLSVTTGQEWNGRGHVQATFVGVTLKTPTGLLGRTMDDRKFLAVSDELWARASSGFVLDRPLCQNCGRRGIQRLQTSGELLSWERHRYRFIQGCCGSRNVVESNTCTSLIKIEEEQSVAGCGLTANVARSVKGQFADWICNRDVLLCNLCMRVLRSSKWPDWRVSSRKHVISRTAQDRS